MNSYAIEQLIPQRAPIQMVDRLTAADGIYAETCFTVPQDCLFLDEKGQLEAAGIMEHIAQSASAAAGKQALDDGKTTPPIGYIGEIKKFHLYHNVKAGQVLLTKIKFGASINGITQVTGQTCADSVIIADTQMKIFINPEEA